MTELRITPRFERTRIRDQPPRNLPKKSLFSSNPNTPRGGAPIHSTPPQIGVLPSEYRAVVQYTVDGIDDQYTSFRTSPVSRLRTIVVTRQRCHMARCPRSTAGPAGQQSAAPGQHPHMHKMLQVACTRWCSLPFFFRHSSLRSPENDPRPHTPLTRPCARK